MCRDVIVRPFVSKSVKHHNNLQRSLMFKKFKIKQTPPPKQKTEKVAVIRNKRKYSFRIR